MSAIAGIVNFDGGPVEADRLGAMSGALAARGADGVRTVTWSGAGFAFRTRWTAAEERGARQPVEDETGRLLLVFDGRLDNRVEVCASLGLGRGRSGARERPVPAGNRVPVRDGSDAEIVLRAYQHWGADCAARLLGDFALVVWDAVERTLYCARDAFGVRPLCYCRGPTFLVFASEPHALFLDPRVSSAVNEGMAGEMLAAAVTSQSETLWRDVRRVPPAHWMACSARGDTLRRYWDIHPGPALRQRDAREHAERLLDLLRAAVGARLRADEPVATDLSGGLDSATVTALVCEERARLGAGRGETAAFSLVFPGMTCDERERIRATAGHVGARVTECPPEPPAPVFFHEQVRRYRDLPSYPNGAPMSGPASQAAIRAGFRVVLSGVGGDQWFEGAPDVVAHLLWTGRWREAFRQAHMSETRPGLVSTLWRHGVRPLAPAWARRIQRRLRPPARRAPLVAAAFGRRIGLGERLAAPFRETDRLLPGQRAVLATLRDGWQAHAYECLDRDSAAEGLEYRHPFLDRRLAEFAAAVPYEFIYRDGYTKWILRQAMRGHLPPALLASHAKPDFDEFFAEITVAVARSIPDPGARLVTLGWADPARLPRLRRMPDGTDTFEADQPLSVYQKWAVLALDLWARAWV